jgi:hypothetical protein
LNNNSFNINKVKFFGWEPLLKKNEIKNIVQKFPKVYDPKYFITTNTLLVDDNFIVFCKKNKINLTFSIDWSKKTNLQNRLTGKNKKLSNLLIENTKKYSDFIRINQVITSNNSNNFFNNFNFIYDLWVRKFNFLPEYYKEWTKTWLLNLQRWFDEILKFYQKWNKFELINLENYSKTSFFNLGLVIDFDWKIYATNLILSWIFEKYKNELVIWSVFDGLSVNIKDNNFISWYIKKVNKIIEKEYSNKILKSVNYVDLILNNFCNKWNIKD